jgi:proteasome lid subunit RPN8/RPN11
MRDRRLEWNAEERRRAESAARAAWPEECCGILLGRRRGAGAVVQRAQPVANVRAEDRRRGYEIDPHDLVSAQRRGRRQGLEIVGFYHSHPDGARRPSREDARSAWPEASYVILAGSGAAWAAGSWRLGPDGRMVAERLVERPDGGPG